MRWTMLVCLIGVLGNHAASVSAEVVGSPPPTTQAATKLIEKSATLHGVTLTVSVPARLRLDTPIRVRTCNHSRGIRRTDADWPPEYEFQITLRDEQGKLVDQITPDPNRMFRVMQVLSPGDEVIRRVYLKVLYKSVKPGRYTLSIGRWIGGPQSVAVKDIPVEIIAD